MIAFDYNLKPSTASFAALHANRNEKKNEKERETERSRDSQQRWVGRFIIENNVNTQCAITMETAKCESYTIFLLYFVQTDKNTTFINTLLSTWCTFEVCNVCFMSVHV